MIADGRPRPLLVVTFDGGIAAMFRPKPGEDVYEAALGENFTPMLLNEIVPYVEEHFRQRELHTVFGGIFGDPEAFNSRVRTFFWASVLKRGNA